jgi:hypothetical protein
MGYLDIVGEIYGTCGKNVNNVTINFGSVLAQVTMLDPENFYR